MRMKLNKITLENFKCHQSVTVDFQGRNTSITAKNGEGKTSIADGVYWVMYDKNSEGEKKFGIRPVDTNRSSPTFGEIIHGLVVKVTVGLLVNGEPMSFRKEQHEVVKEVDGKPRYSYTNKYWIDDYAMPEGEFKATIENIIPTDKFKLLADLDYFNNDKKTTPAERRKTLEDMGGKMPQPAGHEELLKRVGKHDIDDYKKTLTDSKGLLVDERAENNIRLDEKERDLTKYAQNHSDSESELTDKRDTCQEKVGALAAKCTELLAGEKQRQEKVEKKNEHVKERLHREAFVKQQTGPVDDLLAEKAKLGNTHADKKQELVDLQHLVSQAESAIESAQSQIEASQLTLKQIRDEITKADDPNCSLCGQAWPADKPKPGLADIKARGVKAKAKIDDMKVGKSERQDELNKLLAEAKVKAGELIKFGAAKDKRIAEINEAIENRPEPDPADDAEWQQITKKVDALQAEIGEPASRQLETLEAEKGLADTLLNELNGNLNKYDTNEENKKRIAELEISNKKITQKIADIIGELDEIAQFKIAKCNMIADIVNPMFKRVTWRLYDYFQNGEINDRVCVCLLNGKPYSDLSKGEKVYANNDTLNTLSDYYAIEVFRFVDDCGDVTLPIEANSQVISLVATIKYVCKQCTIVTHSRLPITECSYCKSTHIEEVKGLQVEIEQDAGKAVA